MKISTKGRYALRLMIDLAEHSNGKYITLKDISARQEISIKYLEQIITQLSKAGLLKSVRGPQGGYKLSKDSKDYTVGDILRVTEGNLSPVACLEYDTNKCNSYEKCSTVDFWAGLYQLIQKYVDSVTLEDLVSKHISKVTVDFSI
ncbi:MAG: Rrf2 family transcriptional regulator [Endomicrobiaceae bacterium]|nr:Rrf2 family transcriptional regulator [Endomicrobiaceae bacterium]